MLNNKFILDACCGGKMFWFNKNHPNTMSKSFIWT